ncbi:alpha-glucosidase [Undibacterium flavidum]|uniref:Alpha-glucosidase n=1 Tax=Undibacterium flavidum TaxID=2762297 RepID=A0ABR6Y7B6_9BURK|nr:alpha-glucosidase [Undibacterium flavidum]MBC3872500.1 alpha-glucosidase [Undibacterium flavidum]
MRRHKLLVLILLVFFGTAQASDKVLNRTGLPTAMQDFDHYQNQQFNPLFDAGSWHGYLLPDRAEFAGTFPGPLLVFEEYSLYLADALERFQIRDSLTGEQFDLARAQLSQSSGPGQLRQTIEWKNLRVHLDLYFLNQYDAIVRYRLENTSPKRMQLEWHWQGQLMTSWDKRQTVAQRFPDWQTTLSATPDGIKVAFSRQRDILNLMTSGAASYQIIRSLPAQTSVQDKSYQSEMRMAPLAAGAGTVFYSIYRYQLTNDVPPHVDVAHLFARAEELISKNQLRWSQWLAKLPATALSTKAFETLIANWRAPAGKIKHDIVVPSTTARWFNGAWAWDSWKHAYALAAVDAQLGKNVMRAMFDYQISAQDPLRPQDAGMLIDTVFCNQDAARGGDGDHWNERNSKPPLAAWAVWELFQQTKDLNWLREMRPRLEAYHTWWYRNRDHNQNGLVEYGATVHPIHTTKDGQLRFKVKLPADPGLPACRQQTDGMYDCAGISAYESILAKRAYQQLELPVQEAAAYESGMDNAARFGFIDDPALQRYADQYYQGNLARARIDWQVRVFENRDAQGALQGYSINQESVDLNAFLYQEKMLLARIADALQDRSAAHQWRVQAQKLKLRIQACFYDAKTGFFYDRQIDAKPENQIGNACQGTLLSQRGRGPEGWSPLWTGAASKAQTKAVMQTMMNPREFLTQVPLPTAALSNPAYDPESYWRGRVWLDQLYFGIVGLHNYGYHQQAQRIQQQFMRGAMGLQGDASIRENYHPLTGRTQGASNFSWSAAHLLMLERLSQKPRSYPPK